MWALPHHVAIIVEDCGRVAGLFVLSNAYKKIPWVRFTGFVEAQTWRLPFSSLK